MEWRIFAIVIVIADGFFREAVVMEKTVVKGLKVIEALANSKGARSLTDLANECGLTKSNAHRLLRTLESCGYVRHDPNARAFEATLRPWDLGNRIFNRTELRVIALPYLEELAALTKETTHLSIFDAGEVIYIGKVDSVHAVRTYVNIGDRAPAYCCATGKAMLAHMPDDVVREVTRDMKRFTKNTIVSSCKLEGRSRTHSQPGLLDDGRRVAGRRAGLCYRDQSAEWRDCGRDRRCRAGGADAQIRSRPDDKGAPQCQ